MRTCRPELSVVLVTGLSGAGKNSILRALEDLGFETMDNPPLATLEELATRAERNLAIGVDARSRGFAAEAVLEELRKLGTHAHLEPRLVFATATDEVLLQRYSETRRLHPLAQSGAVADGIAVERALTAPLARAADLLVDTSELPLPRLRALVEQSFGAGAPGLSVSLVSFAYPAGLPREADLVFDARFLRNPHYDPELRPLSGLDPEVGRFIEKDPDFEAYFAHIRGIVEFLLPRFVQEGKKYATICVGCTGGQHRSVFMIEKLNTYLAGAGWRVRVTHREAAKFSGSSAARLSLSRNDKFA
ncbi:MAG: RNase adaptor protein RapZ [Rhodospirillales bacterium 20-64-7]|nr:MAG: RNase adaptor protein RapZ [Rhodospirillales bacterium 20-64-7]